MVSQPLLSDECPPTCSTGSLALEGCAQAVAYMAITSAVNPVHWDQLRAQRSVTSMGELYFFRYKGEQQSSSILVT